MSGIKGLILAFSFVIVIVAATRGTAETLIASTVQRLIALYTVALHDMFLCPSSTPKLKEACSDLFLCCFTRINDCIRFKNA